MFMQNVAICKSFHRQLTLKHSILIGLIRQYFPKKNSHSSIRDIHINFCLNVNGVDFRIGISLLQMQIKMCTNHQILKCVSL